MSGVWSEVRPCLSLIPLHFKFPHQTDLLCAGRKLTGNGRFVIYISYILHNDLSPGLNNTNTAATTDMATAEQPPSLCRFPSSHPHLDIPPPLGGHLVPNQACPLQHSSPSSILSTPLSGEGIHSDTRFDPPPAPCLSRSSLSRLITDTEPCPQARG